MKRNILTIILLAIVVDAFFFDFTLRLFPIANSKMILAVIGIFAFVYKGIQDHKVQLSSRVFVSGLLALVFSLWCYFSIVMNGSNEREFVTYFVSFATWVGGAYGAYAILKTKYKRVDLTLITYYLALVCVSQCIIALLIDNIPAVRNLVNSTFSMATDFYERGGRLYGIACALDPAGIRFAAVLVLIAHQLSVDDRVRRDSGKSTFFILSFLVITIIGSMISRTTIIGTALGLAFILISNLRMRRGGIVSKVQVNASLLLIFLIGGAVIISAILYNTNSVFREDLRFGFEGFFNWVETGEFRTGSTDHLQTMWYGRQPDRDGSSERDAWVYSKPTRISVTATTSSIAD